MSWASTGRGGGHSSMDLVKSNGRCLSLDFASDASTSSACDGFGLA